MGKTVLLDGMNGIEGAEFYDSLFNNAFFDDAKKLNLVTRMRDFAIQYLQPVTHTIPRVMTNDWKAAYKAKGISIEWDLTASHHVHEFCSTASRNDSLTSSQKAAVDLLSHCTQAIERAAVSDLLWRWIRNDYMKLDTVTVAKGEVFTDPPPRGLDDLSEVLLEILKHLGRGMSAKDVWRELEKIADPHSNGAVIQEVADDTVYWRTSGKDKSTTFRSVANRLIELRKKI